MTGGEIDSPEVQAAIEREKRLWTLEQDVKRIESEDESAHKSIDQKLDLLITEVTALKERVGVQNGRVTKNENALIQLGVRNEDFETLQFKPLQAVVNAIGAQVKELWESRVSLNGQATGRASVLRLQWRVLEAAGKIVGSSVVIGGVILLLNALGIDLGGSR